MASHKKEHKIEAVRPIITQLQDKMAERGWRCEIAGSVRRGKSVVNDIDVVIGSPGLKAGVEAILEVPGMSTSTNLERAKQTATILFEDNVQIDAMYVREDYWGGMLMFLTGSAAFNVILRGFAKKDGMKLNQYGLWHNEELIAGKTEELIFQALGLPFIEPAERDLYGDKSKWTPKQRRLLTRRRW